MSTIDSESERNPQMKKRENLIGRFLRAIGPGTITGAADDDPSGIGTYSVAGAQFGTAFLWTAWITWPLMACVQMACARIGMVTGEGLASALEKKLPRWALIAVCGALFLANTLNVGADLSAMGDATEQLTGVASQIWIVIFGVGIGVATVRLNYQAIARALKWLAISLFAYVVVAFVSGPDWRAVAWDSVVPRMPKGKDAWPTLVAIFGTTISPYLFFWQSSLEVEEEKGMGRKTLSERRNATPREIADRKMDVGAGTFFSNIVMYFIILAAASTLHRNGVTSIETGADAAKALEPIAGRFSAWLYAAGILGTGLLAIPTLTGSAAYAMAETFKWDQGLDAKFTTARAFYAVVIASTVAGIAIDFMGVKPIAGLYWSAVANGLLAPVLLVAILFVMSDPILMAGQPSSRLSRWVVGAAAAAMFAAAIGMFVF